MICCGPSLSQKLVRSAWVVFWAFALLIPAAQRECAAYQANPAITTAENPAAPPSPADPLVQQAQEHLQRSEWDAAIEKCNQALKLDEKSQTAYIARGMAYNGKGQFDTAIPDFDKVTGQGGRETWMVTNRAEAYAQRSASLYHKGEYLKAIDSAYFALLERGDHLQANHYRALGYLARNQHDKAINTGNRMIQIDPMSAEGYSHRGAGYEGKGNHDQNIADQGKAIEMQPNLSIAYQRRAVGYFAKGEKAKAMQDLVSALQKVKADTPDGLCDRARIYAMGGDKSKAMIDLDQALKINPNFSKAHFQKGLALLDQGKSESALASFNEAIKLNEQYASAYCFRGYARNSNKDYEAAVEDFTKALSLDQRLIEAYTGRQASYKKLGKTAEASADAAKLKELQPPPPPKTAKKKDDKKKDDIPPPRFKVASKPVVPSNRRIALKSAQEIDRLVEANYQKHKIAPNENTSDAEFVRRIYLDITGSIPSYPQTQKFLGTKDPDKRSLLIDELLNGDAYAGHFYNYWADVLRYTDSLNGNVRGEPFRQWIKQSLAENKSWDKMVLDMMTAEGLVWQNPATGYLQRDANMPLDNMNNTVRIFLGTRIGCAQCHNHPFDRWTQKEFYQMAAFTFGTLTSTGGHDTRYWGKNPNERLQEEYSLIDQEEEDRRNNSYRFNRLIGINMMIVNDQVGRKITLPADYAYDDAKPGEAIEPKALFGKPAPLQPGQVPRKAFAQWLTSKDNPRFALVIANRLWKQAFGSGQIEPVDDMMDSTVAENPELMTFLESEMKRLDFDMKEYLRILFNTQTYQRQACVEEILPGQAYHFPGPMLRRMTAEQVWDSFLTLAVLQPDEYRELPATVKTNIMGVNLNEVSAPKLLEAEFQAAAVDGGRGAREAKHHYKGVLMARASELPSPVPPNHFLRMFGQSDRELISASSTSGSVPQVLFMFNGPITHMLLEKNSMLHANVMKKKTVPEGVKSVFLTILSREPDAEELKLAEREIKENGPAGYGNVIWSLVNTREFLFIQ